MQKDTTLNLLVIDDDQLYAERLVKLLSAYYTDINLGFLDAKQELLKSLRQQWDVLIFGKAYDLVFTDVVDIVQKKNIDLPLLCLMSDDTANTSRNEEGLPAVLDSTMIKALVADKESAIIIAIRLQHDHLMTRRQLNKLNNLLAQAEQRANILIKNSKSAVAYIDQGVHIFANDPYLQLFGFESVEEIIGIPVIDLIANGDNVQAFKQFLRQFDRGDREQVEFTFKSRRADGSHFQAQLQLAMASLDAEPRTQIIIQQNNSSSAEITKHLAEAQRHDSLTGLSNRLAFEEHFDILYKRVLAGKVNAGLFFIGLDNIGKISLSLGLQGIDITIQKVADKLNELVTDSYISRFNDTSFAILVEKVTTQQLQALAERIRLHISEMLIEVGQRTTNTTASIAVVAIEKNAPKPQLLLERALETINHIRTESSTQDNAYHLYDPMEHADSDDSALAETLMNALTQDRFELMFQPIYDINDDRSNFFEVYLRLPLADAQNTILLPDDFMTVAKKHNLREKIDRWVLINACKQLNEVRKTHPQLRILVSLTSASLVDKNLIKGTSQLIKAIGGALGALTIQFDERDVANHLTVAKTQFAALNQISCQVAIQHFGISAKALEISQLVKPNLVRLAKSYVDGIDTSDNLQTVKSLISQANNFNADVLMPYIEDAATMSIAWSVGARYLQGYYLEEASNTINAM
ncbi:EAL domain-containing protein [Psychrobacter urativorans]|uniref:EAL domain-containing protein n=1 Tax=Psychrobacter urativorans TaxID=45610 RepID=UPI001918AADB|nr:GGDEF domain-containing phosphodiesterase [Psychrobacter urativorans]